MEMERERHTNESESSSLGWLTPTTMDIERSPEGIKKRIAYRKSVGRQYVEGCLTEQVKNWPTMTVDDSKNNGGPSQFRRKTKGKQRSLNLNAFVLSVGQPSQEINPEKTASMEVDLFGHPVQEKTSSPGKNPELWGTPRVSPGMTQTVGYSQKSIQEKGYKARLEGSVAMTQPENRKMGKLNPNWVEQLMGLPVGWTQLPAAWMQSPTE